MPAAEVLPADQLQSRKYNKSQWIQLLNRFIDFSSMAMIVQTLPDYVAHLGGTEYEYYLCIGLQSIMQIVGTWILGVYVDGGPGRMLPAYLATSVLSVLGNTLYVSAGTVPAISSVWTLVVARAFVGLGCSNAILGVVYATEVCTEDERQKWMVRNAMTRSQGSIWGPLVAVALSAVSAPDAASLFGYAVLPGWFQLVCRTVVAGLLWWTWAAPPEQGKKAGQAGEAVNGAQDPSFGDFMRQRRVCVVFLTIFFSGTLAATQQGLPVVVRKALGWKAAESGIPFAGQAVFMTVGQILSRMLTKKGVEDYTICMLGCFVLTAVCAGTVLFWVLLDVHGGKHPPFMVVLGPFQLMAFLSPLSNVGSVLTLTRLSVEDVPKHKAKLQSMVFTTQALCVTVSAAWLALTYAGDRATREGVPRTLLASFVPFGIVVSALLPCQRDALKPNSNNQQGTPLLE